MPLSDLIERARQGDASAIARLITRSLADRGIVANARWQGTHLQILLEGDDPLAQVNTVPIIRRGLQRLQLTCSIDQVSVVSRQVGQTAIDWQDHFLLDVSPDPEDGLYPEENPPTNPMGKGNNPLTPAQGSPSDPLVSDHALVALTQLGPLFGYLTVVTNGLVGFPFFWWGGTFLLPWRIVPPLVLLMVRGQESAFVRQQSKHAINFQLSMMIYWIITIALMFVLIGFLLAIPLALLELVCIIIAAVKASEGKVFQYPLAIPFVK
jgi:uncharacterized Tic20 family protein